MAVLVVLAAGVVYLAYLVRAVLAPFLGAVVVAFVLEPPVRFLEERRLPRVGAILVVYLAVGVVVAAFLLWLIPVFVRQLTALADTLPTFANEIEGFLARVQVRYSQAGLPAQIRTVLDGAVARAEADLLIFIQSVLSGLFGAVSALFGIVLAPFLAFYFLRDRDVIRRQVMAVVPVSTRGETLRAITEVSHVVAGWIRGQLLVSAVVGIMVGVATFLVGLPFSAILGVIAGVTNIIPYFGPVIGAIPAVSLALLRGPLLAVETAVLLLLVQQVDSIFITPKLVGVNVGLHPLVVIFSLLAGAELFGLGGMLLAVPVVAVGRVFLKHLLGRLMSDWKP